MINNPLIASVLAVVLAECGKAEAGRNKYKTHVKSLTPLTFN